MKIGMYSNDEILEHLTEGEGRGFLGRSMYDAIKETFENKDKEIERLQNIIDELEKYLEEESKYDEYKDVFYRENMGYVLDKLKKLKENNNEVNKQINE